MLITALITVLIICLVRDVTKGGLLWDLIDWGPQWLSVQQGRQICPLGWNWVRGLAEGPPAASEETGSRAARVPAGLGVPRGHPHSNY